MPIKPGVLVVLITRTMHRAPFPCTCVQNKKAEDLAGRGGGLAQQGLDIFVQRDEWDKVWFKTAWGASCASSACVSCPSRHAWGISWEHPVLQDLPGGHILSHL
eukprot:1152272-Pelagomonas_calceolata.AAC.7